MTSQQDETARRAAGEDLADDPIVIERRDEILTGGGPADDVSGYDPAAGPGSGYDQAGSDRPGSDRPGYGQAGSDRPGYEDTADEETASEEPASDEPASEEPASEEPASDEPASDELIGRHAVPDTGGADPAPLVVPAEAPRADMSDAPGPAAGAGQEFPDPAPPGAAFAGPAEPGPAATSGVAADVTPPGVSGTPGVPAGVAGPPGASAADRSPAPGVPGGGIPAAALSEQQWPSIQAMFVDDPKGSVQRAAAAADEVLKAFVASLEREQMALRTSWENDSETTTEDLRTALQQYRAFCGRLEGLA